jgi:hypothetical protein
MRQFLNHKMFLLVISSLIISNGLICAKEQASYSISGVNMKEILLNHDILFNCHNSLQSAGYDVNDIEDIKRAAFTDIRFSRRLNALRLLANKMGDKSIPLLKKGLEDTDPYVRSETARLLGMFGDKSGIPILLKDMQDLVKDSNEYKQIYLKSSPNAKYLPASVSSAGKRFLMSMYNAIALAELGDCSAFQLVAKTAVENTNWETRGCAIMALTAMTTIDKEILEKNGAFPEVVLLDIAESKMDDFTIKLMNTGFIWYMKREPAIPILDKLQKLPSINDSSKEIIGRTIKDIKQGTIKTENKDINEPSDK